MKDELGGKIMKELVALTPTMYNYVIGNGCVDKKPKGTKKWVIKQNTKFGDYKKCLQNIEMMLTSQKRFRYSCTI